MSSRRGALLGGVLRRAPALDRAAPRSHETPALLGGDDARSTARLRALAGGARESCVPRVAPAAARARRHAARAPRRGFSPRRPERAMAGRSACEVTPRSRAGSACGRRGRRALDQVYERWDGHGAPAASPASGACRADLHVADVAGIAHLRGGGAAARGGIDARRRALRPGARDAFTAAPSELLDGSTTDRHARGGPRGRAAAAAAFPRASSTLSPRVRRLRRPQVAVDARPLAGVSRGSPRARRRRPARRRRTLGSPASARPRPGRACPTAIWDKPGPLPRPSGSGSGCTPTTPSASSRGRRARPGSRRSPRAHHERLDGSRLPPRPRRPPCSTRDARCSPPPTPTRA